MLSLFWYLGALVFLGLLVVSEYLLSILNRRILATRAELGGDYQRSGFSVYEKFSASDLKRHNGLGRRGGLIAYKGKVHNVTVLPHWIGGYHFQKHRAGTDLTEAIKKAPHPDTLLKGAPIVGDYDPMAAESGSPNVRELDILTARHHWLMTFEIVLAAAAIIILALRYL
ncbi:MAG: cytochrome b5 domain-containing protein [Nitrospinota bacterium]